MTRWPWHGANPFSGRDFLDLVPMRVEEAEDDPRTGLVVVLLPRFRGPVLGRLLQPRLPASRRWVKVRLDAPGSLLWRATDGQRPIGDLVPAYEQAFPDDRDEATERVCRWFYAAYEHRLVVFRNL